MGAQMKFFNGPFSGNVSGSQGYNYGSSGSQQGQGGFQGGGSTSSYSVPGFQQRGAQVGGWLSGAGGNLLQQLLSGYGTLGYGNAGGGPAGGVGGGGGGGGGMGGGGGADSPSQTVGRNLLKYQALLGPDAARTQGLQAGMYTPAGYQQYMDAYNQQAKDAMLYNAEQQSKRQLQASGQWVPYQQPGQQSRAGNRQQPQVANQQQMSQGYNPNPDQAAQQGAFDASMRLNRSQESAGAPSAWTSPDPMQQQEALAAQQQMQGAQAALQGPGSPTDLSQGVLGGYRNLYDLGTQLVQNYGRSQMVGLQDAYQQEQARQQQGLVNRGLGNTTVQNAVDTGLAQAQGRNMLDLGERISQYQLGTVSSLGNNYLQNALGIGNQQLAALMGVGGQNIGNQLGLSTDLLNQLARMGIQTNQFGQSYGSAGSQMGMQTGNQGQMGFSPAQLGGQAGIGNTRVGPDNMYHGGGGAPAFGGGFGGFNPYSSAYSSAPGVVPGMGYGYAPFGQGQTLNLGGNSGLSTGGGNFDDPFANYDTGGGDF